MIASHDSNRVIGRVFFVFLAVLFVAVGCSGGGDAVTPSVNETPELKDVNVYPPEGRTLLDAYQLTLNKKTREVSLTKIRTALVHYNITIHASGPHCTNPDCVNVGALYMPVENAVDVSIMVTNLYDDNGTQYDGFDVRAIFVQVDTDGTDDFVYNNFDLVYPECDYTDLYANNEGMPGDQDALTDFGGTNPFLPFYAIDLKYAERDRALAYEALDVGQFILAINEEEEVGSPGWNDDIKGLIMIDACQTSPPDPNPIPGPPWPNCPEPYMIEFYDPADAYPHVSAGGQSDNYEFKVYDHQATSESDYEDDITGTLTFFATEDLTGIVAFDNFAPFNHYAQYHFNVTPDGSIDAGLYEGVIEMSDDGVGPTLKRKIWVTVERDPVVTGSDIDDELEGVLSISSPVRANIDGDDALETIFTAGNKLFALGTPWVVSDDEFDGLEDYYFVGDPTIFDIDKDDTNEILLVINHNLYIIDGSGNNLVIEESGISVVPHYVVGPPVPVNVDGGDYEIFILSTGDAGDLTLSLYDDECNNIWWHDQGDGAIYFGAPAILDDGDNTYAFMIRQDGQGWHLDGWLLENNKPTKKDSVPLIAVGDIITTFRHSPVVGKVGEDWVIYASTNIYLYMYPWAVGEFDDGWNTALPSNYSNPAGQLALGDINRDGNEDIVVPLRYGVAAFTGYVPGHLTDSLKQIWFYDAGNGSGQVFGSPALIDCNNDKYLDVVIGLQVDVQNDPDYRLVVLDGSPFNNNNRTDANDRVIWSWKPDSDVFMGNRCPVLTETTDGTLRFGVVFRDTVYPDPHASGDAIYREIDTKFGFNWVFEEGLYRDPWLKTRFSLNNWGNSQELFPPWEE